MNDTVTRRLANASGPVANHPAMQCGQTAATDFGPAPIEPTWILEGSPVARSHDIAKASDDQLSCNLWDCTAGTFRWHYRCDEIVHILEGEVTIQENGNTRTLRAGDVAFFPQGLETVWTVPQYVKKFAIHRSVERSLVRRVASKAKQIVTRVIQGGRAAAM